jgi:hypothetical protein
MHRFSIQYELLDISDNDLPVKLLVDGMPFTNEYGQLTVRCNKNSFKV